MGSSETTIRTVERKRYDRVFFIPKVLQGPEEVFVSICPETGEVKECRDLVTLLQQVGYDLGNGHSIKLMVNYR